MDKELETQFKEILPSLIDLKESSEETGKSIKELSDELIAIKGNFEKLEKEQTIAGKRLADVKPSGLDLEGKKDFAKFFIGMVKGNRNDVKAIYEKYSSKALDEGTGANGGYLVPEAFSNVIEKQIIQQSVILNQAQRVPMTVGYKLPILSELTTVSANWTNEAVALTESNPTFSKQQIDAEKLAGYSLMSNELLDDDAVGIVDYLVGRFADSMAQKIDFQGFQGSGSPFTGILNATGVNAVTMSAGNTGFSNVTFDNLTDAESVITYGNVANAKYFLHNTILNVLKKVKDTTGNYIYSPPAVGSPATIWGYPVQVVNQMPKLSDTAISTPFIAFGDLKNLVYATVKEMDVVLDKSIKVLNDQSVLVVRKRIALAVSIPANFSKIVTATV